MNKETKQVYEFQGPCETQVSKRYDWKQVTSLK
jgi:hypothetical protein